MTQHRTITVAAIQARSQGHLTNPDNVPHAIDLLEQAADLGADMACFPEAYPATGEREICEAAQRLHLFVIAGFVPREGDRIYNDCILIDAGGHITGRQRKVHVPPGVEIYSHGKDYGIMETPWGPLAMLICIDGWGFPEGFYRAHEAGAELIVNPNLIFKKKPQRRMSLLSRILDYRIPIVAPNNPRWSFRLLPGDEVLPPEGGGSLILVPPAFHTVEDIGTFMREASSCEGWIVSEAGDEEEILIETIDLDEAAHTRSLWNRSFLGLA